MRHSRIISAICILLFSSPHAVLASKTHVVRKSESLHSIARKYHVSVDELKAVNNLTGTHLDQGEKVIIPSHADGNGQQQKTKRIETAQTYTVAKGDTLPKIAKRAGVKMSDVRRLNGLKGNRIKLGQVLVLNEVAPSIAVAEAPRMELSPNRLQLVNRELLNEQEFSESLAELSDIDAERPVDLAKSIEENSQNMANLKKSAYGFLGARYRFGGNSRTGLDCSSFVQQAYRELNVKLPRTAREQFNVGTEVARGDLRKGDLVFFQTYARYPSHVGIYLGNRKMIHASSRDRRVVISSMDTDYYLSRYLGAKRVGKASTDTSFNFNDLLLGVEEEKETDVLINDTLGLTLSLNN